MGKQQTTVGPKLFFNYFSQKIILANQPSHIDWTKHGASNLQQKSACDGDLTARERNQIASLTLKRGENKF